MPASSAIACALLSASRAAERSLSFAPLEASRQTDDFRIVEILVADPVGFKRRFE